MNGQDKAEAQRQEAQRLEGLRQEALRDLARVLARAVLHHMDNPSDVAQMVLDAGFAENHAGDSDILARIDPRPDLDTF